MKGGYVLFVILLIVAGCSHDVVNPVNPDSYIKCKLNGADVEFAGDAKNLATTGVGVAAIKQGASVAQGIPKTRYIIQGQNGLDKVVSLVIITDSLKPSQTYYSADSTNWGVSFIRQNGDTYSTNQRATDKFQVNISRYSDGTIDGTFSGLAAQVKTVNGVPVYKDGVISEGSFQKVNISY